jgi:hypothetical protein
VGAAVTAKASSFLLPLFRRRRSSLGLFKDPALLSCALPSSFTCNCPKLLAAAALASFKGARYSSLTCRASSMALAWASR